MSGFRVVTVCTHNRTRSPMMMALIQRGLDERLGVDVANVSSCGFETAGLAPIPAAVDAMRSRGIDISGHRSAVITAERLAGADLILTAERDHVVRLSVAAPDAFDRAFTLPEFLRRADAAAAHRDAPLRKWVAGIGTGRSAAGYLAAPVGDVVDPTGWSRRRFGASVARIAEMCDAAVAALIATQAPTPKP